MSKTSSLLVGLMLSLLAAVSAEKVTAVPLRARDVQIVSDARARGEYEVPTVFGLNYHEAREILIESGWMPLLQRHLYPQQEFSLRFGNGERFWDLGYWEILSCSGTAENFCRFEFTDPSGRKLVVITAGLEDPEIPAQALVRNVSLEP